MTVRRFTVTVNASEEWLAQDPAASDAIRDALQQQTARLRGPRGGTYHPVGPLYGFRDGLVGDDFMRGTRTFAASVDGRYVRPSR